MHYQFVTSIKYHVFDLHILVSKLEIDFVFKKQKTLKAINHNLLYQIAYCIVRGSETAT